MKRIKIEPEFDAFVRKSGNVVVKEKIEKSPTFENADYYFPESNVVAELKCLEENKLTDPRTQKKLRRLWILWRQRGDVSGKVPPVIHSQGLPKTCQQEMYQVYANPIRDKIKKANRQIRDTKEKLGEPDAKGLLLMANDGNLALDPAALIHIIFQSIRSNFSEINDFVFFTANLFVRLSSPPKQSLIWFHGFINESAAIEDSFIKGLFNGWRLHVSQVQGVEIESVEDIDMAEFWHLSHRGHDGR